MDKNIVSPFFLTHGVYLLLSLRNFNSHCPGCVSQWSS